MTEHQIKLPLNRRLNTNILMYGVCPLLERFRDLISLASTSKAMRSLVYSADCVWSSAPCALCMHAGCSGCGRDQVGCALIRQVVTKTAAAHLVVHLKLDDLVPFLVICQQNKRGLLRRLQLLIEPPSSSSPIFPLGESTMDIGSGEDDAYLVAESSSLSQTPKLNIEDLIISIPSPGDWQVGLANMFRLVGATLRVLKFRFASPANLFATLPSLRLEQLEVDGPQDVHQLLALELPSLLHLRLNNSRIRLSGKLQCPRLQTFEFYGRLASDGSLLWRNAEDVTAAVAALPSSLLYLEMRLDSRFVNTALSSIAESFPVLEGLTLDMPDEAELVHSTKVSKEVMLVLTMSCPRLYSIEFRNSFVSFEADAVLYMAQFRNLRKLRLVFDDDVVALLPDLLAKSSSLEELHLYQDRGDIMDEMGSDARWDQMQAMVDLLQEQFTTVYIHLEDDPFYEGEGEED